MSDLAPFVAAVLRDPVVQELMEENKKLREQLDEKSMLKITGPGGTPVYYQAHVRTNGKLDMPERGSYSDWIVTLPKTIQNDDGNGHERTLSWNRFEYNIEVRLGGIVLIPLEEPFDINGCLISRENGNNFSFHYPENGAISAIKGRLKQPNTSNQFFPTTIFPGEVSYQHNGEPMTEIERLARSQDVVIDAVLLDQTYVRGLIDSNNAGNDDTN